MTADKTSPKATVESDAKGQFERNRGPNSNNGVASAKPRDITGSDDATVHKRPPGSEKGQKDWDINYDERDMNEGDFRG